MGIHFFIEQSDRRIFNPPSRSASEDYAFA